MVEKTWKVHPAAPELDGLSWHTMACDTMGKRLVVVGADKKADNPGWSRTVVYDIGRGKWSRLDVTDRQVVEEHRGLVSAKEACIDLVGRIRLAWYRDPKGVGTEEELTALGKRCEALEKMPQMSRFAEAVDELVVLLSDRRVLDALKSARALQRKIETFAEEQYPVPPSRRNSPLAFDEKNKLFVLFGGDHEDYLTNDTWVLDLGKRSWRRCKPERAPSPRAGHALCGLGRSGKVVLYEGYVQTSSGDYGSVPYWPLDPRQLWLYDVGADRWDLLGTWPLPSKDDRTTPAPLPTSVSTAPVRSLPRTVRCLPATAPAGCTMPVASWSTSLPTAEKPGRSGSNLRPPGASRSRRADRCPGHGPAAFDGVAKRERNVCGRYRHSSHWEKNSAEAGYSTYALLPVCWAFDWLHPLLTGQDRKEIVGHLLSAAYNQRRTAQRLTFKDYALMGHNYVVVPLASAHENVGLDQAAMWDKNDRHRAGRTAWRACAA